MVSRGVTVLGSHRVRITPQDVTASPDKRNSSSWDERSSRAFVAVESCDRAWSSRSPVSSSSLSRRHQWRGRRVRRLSRPAAWQKRCRSLHLPSCGVFRCGEENSPVFSAETQASREKSASSRGEQWNEDDASRLYVPEWASAHGCCLML